MARLFLPQSTLEEWAAAEQADLREGQLHVPQEKTSFPAVPAVHFTKLVSGADEHKLLSKVKTEEQLRQLGAEQMADSVLLGENAYEVVTGYIADVPVAAPPAQKKGSSETDMLAAFLLDKL